MLARFASIRPDKMWRGKWVFTCQLDSLSRCIFCEKQFSFPMQCNVRLHVHNIQRIKWKIIIVMRSLVLWWDKKSLNFALLNGMRFYYPQSVTKWKVYRNTADNRFPVLTFLSSFRHSISSHFHRIALPDQPDRYLKLINLPSASGRKKRAHFEPLIQDFFYSFGNINRPMLLTIFRPFIWLQIVWG